MGFALQQASEGPLGSHLPIPKFSATSALSDRPRTNESRENEQEINLFQCGVSERINVGDSSIFFVRLDGVSGVVVFVKNLVENLDPTFAQNLAVLLAANMSN